MNDLEQNGHCFAGPLARVRHSLKPTAMIIFVGSIVTRESKGHLITTDPIVSGSKAIVKRKLVLSPWLHYELFIFIQLNSRRQDYLTRFVCGYSKEVRKFLTHSATYSHFAARWQ